MENVADNRITLSLSDRIASLLNRIEVHLAADGYRSSINLDCNVTPCCFKHLRENHAPQTNRCCWPCKCSLLGVRSKDETQRNKEQRSWS